jgi:hypothetical protein
MLVEGMVMHEGMVMLESMPKPEKDLDMELVTDRGADEGLPELGSDSPSA